MTSHGRRIVNWHFVRECILSTVDFPHNLSVTRKAHALHNVIITCSDRRPGSTWAFLDLDRVSSSTPRTPMLSMSINVTRCVTGVAHPITYWANDWSVWWSHTYLYTGPYTCCTRVCLYNLKCHNRCEISNIITHTHNQLYDRRGTTMKHIHILRCKMPCSTTD